MTLKRNKAKNKVVKRKLLWFEIEHNSVTERELVELVKLMGATSSAQAIRTALMVTASQSISVDGVDWLCTPLDRSTAYEQQVQVLDSIRVELLRAVGVIHKALSEQLPDCKVTNRAVLQFAIHNYLGTLKAQANNGH